MLLVPLAEGSVIAGILLVHVDLLATASLSQKRTALETLHNRYDDLVEEIAERRRGADPNEIIQTASPRALVFDPIERIIAG